MSDQYKICTHCKIAKSQKEYYRRSPRTTALGSWCRTCSREAGRRYSATHKKEGRLRNARDRAEHKEKFRQRAAAYRASHKGQLVAYRIANKAKLQTYQRIYRAAHAAKLKAANRKYRIEHRGHLNSCVVRYRKKRRTLDPAFVMKGRLGARLREALKAAMAKKKWSTMQLVGCSIEQLMEHLQRQFKPGMAWNNRHLWHIDHIRPCSSFNLLDVEQQRQCFHYTNLQPLWAGENVSKSNKVDIKNMKANF